MTEKEQKSKSGTSLNLSSKFWKTILVVLAVLLIFAGPTYIVYALLNVLDMDYVVSMASGFALFMVGLVLLLYLINKKVIS